MKTILLIQLALPIVLVISFVDVNKGVKVPPLLPQFAPLLWLYTVDLQARLAMSNREPHGSHGVLMKLKHVKTAERPHDIAPSE